VKFFLNIGPVYITWKIDRFPFQRQQKILFILDLVPVGEVSQIAFTAPVSLPGNQHGIVAFFTHGGLYTASRQRFISWELILPSTDGSNISFSFPCVKTYLKYYIQNQNTVKY
jgi:hypothetical protein